MERYYENDQELSVDQLLVKLETSAEGLSQKQAEEKLKLYGPNQIIKKQIIPSAVRILFEQFKNWLVIILLIAALISFFSGEQLDAMIVVSIVSLSIFFGFYQEYRVEKTLKKLKKIIVQKVKVKRDKQWIEINSKELVVGDVIKLGIGDVVSADIRLIVTDQLLTNESALTGESAPVLKNIKGSKDKYSQPQKMLNMVFMGTTVMGGYGEGVVVATGNDTFFGKTAKYLEDKAPETEFQKETRKFGGFLFRIILLMTVFVFTANACLHKGILDSFLFAIALAVGITPELLPAITTVTLSRGALKMAQKKVVVKRLMSVENLGNIDTICTDKTGTLTKGVFALGGYIDVNGVKNKDILIKALLCTSNFVHNGNRIATNPTDQALWRDETAKEVENDLREYKLLNENEFDFERRRFSVLVKKNKKNILMVKGSPDSILTVSALNNLEKKKILEKVQRYEDDGFRVIALAEKFFDKEESTKDDETNLQLIGFLLFNDPVKPEVKESLELFKKLGVNIKILSGDSVTVTKSVAKNVGLEILENKIISGDELNGLSDSELIKYAYKYNLFARLTPEQKYKIVTSLNKEGHVVGFLGDGINDAPALKAADVGIAVNTGAPVAKEAADIILLRKDLSVLAEGIETGRKTFGNIIKYILNTVSANYGNMFTVAVSSLFIPFIPLLPKQILLNNFISDMPLLTIATDNVDQELIKKPKRWDIKLIGRFMFYFGVISSLFDLMMILPMIFWWNLPPIIFRTAWFVESSLSEMMITFAIRTKLPFYKSQPSKLLLFASLFFGAMVIILPLVGVGQQFFEFTNIPIYLWGWIASVLLIYFALVEMVKRMFFKKYEL